MSLSRSNYLAVHELIVRGQTNKLLGQMERSVHEILYCTTTIPGTITFRQLRTANSHVGLFAIIKVCHIGMHRIVLHGKANTTRQYIAIILKRGVIIYSASSSTAKSMLHFQICSNQQRMGPEKICLLCRVNYDIPRSTTLRSTMLYMILPYRSLDCRRRSPASTLARPRLIKTAKIQANDNRQQTFTPEEHQRLQRGGGQRRWRELPISSIY